MSGGSFNYDCFKISNFADKLEHKILSNSQEFSKETIFKLKKSLKIIKVAAELAKEIEWLYSYDHSEKSLQALIDNIITKKHKGDNMTDLQKLKQLFDSFGIEYEEAINDNIYIRCMEGNNKVNGYTSFYTRFTFNTDESFIEMGAYE